MVAQEPAGTAVPLPSREDTFAFDIRNGLRVWLGEAVARGEVTARDAENAIANINRDKAIDVTEDQTKLWLGPIKDSFGNVSIAQKLVKDFSKWWNVRVYFKAGANGDLVIIKGWPNGRRLLRGTRYRVDNVKIMELQIGRPGIEAAAKESARFGLILVVAVDLVQFARDKNFAHLLGSLTVDCPSVILASAIGAAAGAAATALTTGAIAIGSFALGPALVAFGVGILAGYALYRLDKYFGITEKVTAAYEAGLEKLKQWWHRVGAAAQRKWIDFVNSGFVHDMQRGFDDMGERLGRDNNSLSMLQSLM